MASGSPVRPAHATAAEPKQIPSARRHAWVTGALAAGSLSVLALVVADVVASGWRTPRDFLLLAAAFVGLSLTAWRAARAGSRLGTIRSRLQVSFVALAVLAVIGASAPTIYVGYVTGQRQALARIDSLASERQVRIRAWMDALLGELRATLGEEYALDRARVSLKLSDRGMLFPFYAEAMRGRLQWQISQSSWVRSYMLVDLEGQVTLSTTPGQEGSPAGALFPGSPASSALGAAFVRLPYCTGPDSPPAVLVGIPVTDANDTVLGTLMALASVEGLYSILREPTGLGESGEAFLVDTAGRPLVQTASEPLPGPGCLVGSQGAQIETVETDAFVGGSGSGVFQSYRGRQVNGAHRVLEELGATLVVEQDLAESSRPIYLSLALNVVFALGFAFLAVLAALMITRSITRPLVSLADTASRIAARDLDLQAPVGRSDEVGALAVAFNSMTSQLRELIGGLEGRVAERTEALQVRAVQLETSASVSREITSILNIDELLQRVVERIREAFGYYYVQVFLADEETRTLSLQASSSHRSGQTRSLNIGSGSLNGEAAASNRAILVNDVARDDRYRPDESLTETRSELVVPLRIGSRVLGTLDVHSSQLDGFTSEDEALIQSLGDQIAIAIENARLYDRTRELAVLHERNRLARELHDSVTQSLYSLTLFAQASEAHARDRQWEQLQPLLSRIRETADSALRQMRLQLYQLRPPELAQQGLVAALEHRLDAVERRAGISAQLVAQDWHDMPPEIEEGLYLIAQEALNNALKHSGASRVEVILRARGCGVELEVADDGRGFDAVEVDGAAGMGLGTMKERAEALGGVLCVSSAPGGGVRVRVTVPDATGKAPARSGGI